MGERTVGKKGREWDRWRWFGRYLLLLKTCCKMAQGSECGVALPLPKERRADQRVLELLRAHPRVGVVKLDLRPSGRQLCAARVKAWAHVG
jgi:hypothetical protein